MTNAARDSSLALPMAPPGDQPGGSDDSAAIGSSGPIDDEGPADGLTLDAAIERMLAANLDLLALKFEIPQADADILTAGLRANPLIYSDAQLVPYGNYTSTRPTGPTEYDISITQPIDVSGKRKSRVKVARAAKSTLEAQFQDVVRRQIGNLYRAFLDLQTARLNVLSAEAAVKDRRAIVDRARRRARAGEDLSRLEAHLEKARDALDEARHAIDDARDALALLLNLSPDEARDLQPRGGLRDLAPAAPPVEELTRLALSCRPDLLAARRGVGRAENEVALARANRFDDVFLFYDPYSYQDNRITHQPSGRSWALGMTIPLPVFNRNQGNLARARSNVGQTQTELVALERRVVSEVRLADREYRYSRQVLDRAEQVTLPRSRQARAKAASDLASHAIDVDAYLDRLEDDNDAARAYLDTLVRHRRGMLDLNTAVGTRILP